MFVPYSTDAPVYHLPFATVGLIVANVFLYFIVPQPSETDDTFRQFALEFNRVAPLQWLTCNFMHLGFIHLAGNMIFLWVFGLIVEGKIGWWRFLSVYALMGVAFGAVIQLGVVLISPQEGMGAGASAVIFGLIGISAIWAPKNDVYVFFWFLGPRIFEIPVVMFGFLYFAMEFVPLALRSFALSSELFHVAGLAIGIPVGLVFWKRGWVDCEGWDLITVLSGRDRGSSPGAWRENRADSAQSLVDSSKEQAAGQRQLVFRSLEQAIASGEPAAAVAIYLRHKSQLADHKSWTSETLTALIAALHRVQRWNESIPLMMELVERDPERTATIRLKLAALLVRAAGRPKQAIRVLETLPKNLTPQQTRLREEVAARAKQAIDEGDVELRLDE